MLHRGIPHCVYAFDRSIPINVDFPAVSVDNRVCRDNVARQLVLQSGFLFRRLANNLISLALPDYSTKLAGLCAIKWSVFEKTVTLWKW